MRSVKGCTRRDRLYSEDVRKGLNIFNTQDRIGEYKERWIAHLNRVPDGRLPKEVWQYKPIGQRSIRKTLEALVNR